MYVKIYMILTLPTPSVLLYLFVIVSFYKLFWTKIYNNVLNWLIMVSSFGNVNGTFVKYVKRIGALYTHTF